MNKKIIERQRKILEFIAQKIKKSGYPPSVREIGAAVNLSSPATVHSHLKKLEKMGYIRRDSSKPRTIEIISDQFKVNINKDENSNFIFVPLVGHIAAGKPILAEENIEDYFPVTTDFVRDNNDVFVLQVKGDSMVNAGILDRDYIIVRKQNTAINGEIVAVLLEDEATVKRFFKNSKSIKLMPENDYMEPIEVLDAQILGKVIGIIRKYF
ncbi:MAG: transcriptional repressor LexA [Actinobacteria bacterium]|nr:transcriptional repressor LexA [Actinomycetota bacterium]MBL7060220.1 transcriptional repressor LexA [Actinomycetota bacterium]